MKIRYAPYELSAKRELGRARSRKRTGALLRIETEHGPGYADLHPWEELGDEPLMRQLAFLRDGALTALTRNSVALARRDAEARSRRKSLFAGLTIPSSHFLLDDGASIDRAYENGFRLFKLKISGAFELPRLPPDLPTGARMRLDFNERLTPAELRDVVSRLDPARIDFVEDPCPWNPKGWEKFPIRLALDRGADPRDSASWPEVIVIKPVYGNPSGLAKRASRFVVTSYLDHPLGQAAAALFAAEAARDYPDALEPCGLLSHWVYEKTEFSERILNQGPRMLPPEGYGLGFDDLLGRLDWREV